MASFKDIFGFSSRPEESDKPRKWPDEVTAFAIDPFAEDAHEEIIYSREFRMCKKNATYFEGYNRFYLAAFKDRQGNFTVNEYHYKENGDRLLLVAGQGCQDPMDIVKIFCAFEKRAAAKADPVEPTWQNFRAYARDNGIHFDDKGTPYVFAAGERLTNTTYLNKRHLDAFYAPEVGLPPADTWQGLYARLGGRVIESMRHNANLVDNQKEYKQLVESMAKASNDFEKELTRLDALSKRSLRSLCDVSLRVREHAALTGLDADSIRQMTGFFVLVFRMSAVAKIVREYPDFKDGNINVDKISALEIANELLSAFTADFGDSEKDAISRIAASGVADPCRDDFIQKLLAVPQTVADSPLYGFERKLYQLGALEVFYLNKFLENNLREMQLADTAARQVVDLGDNLMQVEEHQGRTRAEHSRLLRRLCKMDDEQLGVALNEYNIEGRMEKVRGLITGEESRKQDLIARIEAKNLAAFTAAADAAAKEAAAKAAAEEAAKNLQPPPPPKKKSWWSL